MRELQLIENPRFSRRRGRNPVYVAPFSYTRGHKRVHVPGYVKNLPGERNPRGGKMARNQLGMRTISRQWFAGVDMMDAGAALGGLAASTMLPGMFVRDPVTLGQKWMKILAAFGAAVGAGFVFQNISATAGKYAVAGGLAGALQQTLAAFTNIKIGQPMRHLSRGMGETTLVSPSFARGSEQVSVIEP